MLGAALLRDAVLRVICAAETIGVGALLVVAISDEAKAFDEHRELPGLGGRSDDADDHDRGGAENVEADEVMSRVEQQAFPVKLVARGIDAVKARP